MSDHDKCGHGKSWKETCADCDRVWGRSFMTDQQQAYAEFYGVNTLDDVIVEMAKHIAKLLAQLKEI